jgi:glutamine amidotransferase
MCRHLAWLGGPRSLASVTLDPPHSLRVQSYAPRRQAHGRINADGWGVGYFTPGRAAPAQWRSSHPMWHDVSFASVAPTIVSTCVVAAVRSATVGMPIEDSAVAPFTDGRWLLSLNGRIERAVFPLGLAAESTCDAAMVAAYTFSEGPEQLGQITADLGGRDPQARLNLLAANGSRVLATTWGDTLSYLVTGDGVVVASEPYDDDPAWVDVPDHHLVDVTNDGVVTTPLEDAA